MKPNVEFTAPDQRFFYPISNEVEFYPGSIKLDDFPRVVYLQGKEPYLLYESEGEIHASTSAQHDFKARGGSTIQAVRTMPANYRRGIHYLQESEYLQLQEAESTYTPTEGSQVIIRTDTFASRDMLDPRFNEARIAVLPATEPLPLYAPSVKQWGQPNYNVLAFINPDDSFVSFYGAGSYENRLIELSVTHALASNSLEAHLVSLAMQGDNLLGLLNVSDAGRTYLEYFDNKYGTHFTPTENPESFHVVDRFGNMNKAGFERCRLVGDAAYRFAGTQRP